MTEPISGRASELIRALDLPWRWAPRGTYSPDENPDGLVSFATAENVSKSWQSAFGGILIAHFVSLSYTGN